MAVSYTHLDVYKRQELKECLFCLRRNEMMFDLEVDTDLIEPVSYTHLDVYKRQLLYPADLWEYPH